MTKKTDEKDSEKYSQMLQRVEDIVHQISTNDIDLDDMVEKVEEGYHLIQKMRDKLATTKERIEDLHKKYEADVNETSEI